jgi:hypothetical protein
MDEHSEFNAGRERMDATAAETLKLKALLQAERAQIKRVRRMQKLWWWAVFLLGIGVGFMIAEKLIDPVTILLPPTGIEV